MSVFLHCNAKLAVKSPMGLCEYPNVTNIRCANIFLALHYFPNYSYTINNSKEGREEGMMKKAK